MQPQVIWRIGGTVSGRIEVRRVPLPVWPHCGRNGVRSDGIGKGTCRKPPSTNPPPLAEASCGHPG